MRRQPSTISIGTSQKGAARWRWANACFSRCRRSLGCLAPASSPTWPTGLFLRPAKIQGFGFGRDSASWFRLPLSLGIRNPPPKRQPCIEQADAAEAGLLQQRFLLVRAEQGQGSIDGGGCPACSFRVYARCDGEGGIAREPPAALGLRCQRKAQMCRYQGAPGCRRWRMACNVASLSSGGKKCRVSRQDAASKGPAGAVCT